MYIMSRLMQGNGEFSILITRSSLSSLGTSCKGFRIVVVDFPEKSSFAMLQAEAPLNRDVGWPDNPAFVPIHARPGSNRLR